jgi:hypothetical protein
LAEVDLIAELAIPGSNGTYGREISDRWDIGGERAFGGYGAAIALAATLADVEMPTALSTHVAFLEPLQFGPIAIEVETLRRGRRVAVARATATQDGRPALTMTTWLSASPLPDRPVVPEPDEPDRNWAGEKWPVLDFADRRGAGYPDSATGFAGERAIELWIRPHLPAPHQLVDVLVLDGHLLDAPLSLLGNIDAAMASLDLSVSWTQRPAPPPGGWRRLRSEGDVNGDGVVAVGSLSWGDDRPYAVAATQALSRR